MVSAVYTCMLACVFVFCTVLHIICVFGNGIYVRVVLCFLARTNGVHRGLSELLIQQQRSQIPSHPDVKFKHLPFYDVLGEIMRPTCYCKSAFLLSSIRFFSEYVIFKSVFNTYSFA